MSFVIVVEFGFIIKLYLQCRKTDQSKNYVLTRIYLFLIRVVTGVTVLLKTEFSAQNLFQKALEFRTTVFTCALQF